MKTIFISLLLFLVVNLSADELQWVDEQIEAIKPPRSGMQMKELAKIKDPFIFSSTTKSKGQSKRNKRYKKSSYKKPYQNRKQVILNKKFHLAIIINDSARINNKWYKLGDSISGYTIAKIDSSFVLLTKDKKNFLLSTHSKNTNLNFKN